MKKIEKFFRDLGTSLLAGLILAAIFAGNILLYLGLWFHDKIYIIVAIPAYLAGRVIIQITNRRDYRKLLEAK